MANEQKKCFLSDIGVSEIEHRIKLKEILPMPNFQDHVYIQTADTVDRISKYILQISFIVTNKQGHILTVDRISDGSRVTAGLSILFSMLPVTGESSRICRSYDEALMCLRTKITSAAFEQDPQLQFLGLARNYVKEKDTTYYFYVFEARFENIDRIDSKEKQEILRTTAHKDHKDTICNFTSFEEIEGMLSSWKNHEGDIAAFKMLACHREIHIGDDNGGAAFVYSPHQHPFEKVHDSYFISHVTADYERYVKPFLAVLDSEKVPYWVHEIHAKQNTDWERSNKIVLPLCRGIISIESANSIHRPHVLGEMSLAIQTKNKCNAYSIRRYFCESLNSTSGGIVNLNDSHLEKFLRLTGTPVNTTNASDIRLALEDLIKEYRHST